uniref:Photosystem I assembly protein ycf3 n=1 Tax=Astrosyne radiata TaxID=1158023 RepID=A0A2U9NT50_9STRA|nr:photosystem I assembly protein ycf3 [Astrosyne radiata]AWT40307.1 photosystem I assembly protein ycf3 [Astrosyne radiata]
MYIPLIALKKQIFLSIFQRLFDSYIRILPFISKKEKLAYFLYSKGLNFSKYITFLDLNQKKIKNIALQYFIRALCISESPTEQILYLSMISKLWNQQKNPKDSIRFYIHTLYLNINSSDIAYEIGKLWHIEGQKVENKELHYKAESKSEIFPSMNSKQLYYNAAKFYYIAVDINSGDYPQANKWLSINFRRDKMIELFGTKVPYF